MKKVLINFACLWALSILIFSCSSDEEESIPVLFSVVEKKLEFSEEGGTKSLTVKSNIAWVVSSDSEWIEIEDQQGEMDGSVRITVGATTFFEERMGEVILKGRTEAVEQKVKVVQRASLPRLEVETELDVPVSGKGGQFKVKVLSNTSWEIVCGEWIVPETTVGENNAEILFEVKKNSLEPRSDTVYFKADPLQRFLVVYQEANDVLTDVEGNEYKIVKIGEDYWMESNLKTKKYRDGTDIIHLDGGDEWGERTEKTAAYTYLDNKEENIEKYGLLYNMMAVKTEKLCPQGWHVPCRQEWLDLGEAAGGLETAAAALKSVSGWAQKGDINGNGTNSSGFNGLPGGSCGAYGGFAYEGDQGVWWASDHVSDYMSFNACLTYHKPNLYVEYRYDKYGLSVRCVKDK